MDCLGFKYDYSKKDELEKFFNSLLPLDINQLIMDKMLRVYDFKHKTKEGKPCFRVL